jgi:hypothetical protein
MVKCRYTRRSDKGAAYPYRQVNVVVDYPGYYAGFTYYVVEPLFDKYFDRFELIGQRFRYTGEGGAKGKRASVAGR